MDSVSLKGVLMADQPGSMVTAAQPRSAEAPYPPERDAWYVVAVLTTIYTFSFIDRQIFSLLVEPLRRDLHISDT